MTATDPPTVDVGALPQLPAQRDLVSGMRSPADGQLDGHLEDPNSGARLQPRAASSSARVEAALAAADAVHRSGSWTDEGIAGRATHLRRLAAALDRRSEVIATADAITTGVPIAVTRLMAGSLSSTVEAVADLASADGTLLRRLAGPQGEVRLHRLPWGPAALITPWNAPAAVGVGKIANALAVGCPVIIKPSEWGPSSVDLVVDAVQEADLPPGVVQLVHGDGAVGAQLVADDRVAVISFTGSQAVGRAIATAAIPRFAALQLELGGANAAIVRADADLPATAAALAKGVIKLNGQWCEAPRRVLAHHDVVDALLDALLPALGGVQIGRSLDPATTMGPLSHRSHHEHVQGAVAQAVAEGARTATADVTVPDRGFFMVPTVLRGRPPAASLREVFGPVLEVHAVADDAEALAAANLGADGLAGYVFTRDVDVGMQLGARVRAGEVKVNGTSVLDMAAESAQSFWGASGIGGHGARDVMAAFGGLRMVGVDHIDPPL